MLHAAEVKSTETVGPVLIHIITDKGHGYEPAVRASDKMHGVAKYDPATGKQSKPKAQVRNAASVALYSCMHGGWSSSMLLRQRDCETLIIFADALPMAAT